MNLQWIIFPAIIVLVILVLVVWLVSTQRGLVGLEERCKNAMSQISVQQNSRWDALSALSDLVKNYDEHEYATLREVIASRAPLSAGSRAREINDQENMLTQTMGKLMALGEAYPDLKSQGLYREAMDSVRQYEENVRKSRMVYNDTVTLLNRRVRAIPTCLIAGLLGFRVHEYLEDIPQKADMPSFRR